MLKEKLMQNLIKYQKIFKKVEDLLEKKLLKLKDFDIEKNMRFESLIKEETEK